MSKQRKPKKTNHASSGGALFPARRVSEGVFILVLGGALFLLLSLLTYRMSDPGWHHAGLSNADIANAGGQVGAYMADALYLGIGYLAYLLPACIAFMAWVILQDHRALRPIDKPMFVLRSLGFILLLVGGCGLLALNPHSAVSHQTPLSGGYLGFYVAPGLSRVFNMQGAFLMLFAMFMTGVTWLTGLSWVRVAEWIGRCTLALIKGISASIKAVFRVELFSKPVKQEAKNTPRVVDPLVDEIPEKTVPAIKPESSASKNPPVMKQAKAAATYQSKTAATGMPPLSLLSQGKPGKPLAGYTHQALETLSREVEQHLLDFGIQADVVAVHPGPVITRFELQLAAGVKASKLSALSVDLARSLSVTSLRVVEIIPGKTVVGIELPNQNRTTVCLSQVLSSDVYQQAHSPLTLALGVDIAGNPMVVDLAKMPHLLVAGTTGSGKSVGVNAMILSLLFKASPKEVRLIMVDPKMLELSVYDGIPHLLTPVVTDMKEAASALRWCVGEMERRYQLMASFGVRNLSGFNAKLADAAARGEPLTDPFWKASGSMDREPPQLEPLPYIVVVIDELADMMMVVGKKVEQLIARIAQKARAAGIHLILATQRPSVDVLTGLIKSNIPTRISFQVSSKIDSRTILDQQGAEQLLGYGDLLFLSPGAGAPLRVHGAFVEDKEVHLVADDWRSRGTPEYIEAVTQHTNDPLEGGLEEEGMQNEADPLYDKAVEFVIQTRKASISAVQRRFKIGYNRAARLVEDMEKAGLVGPMEGGFREVLVSNTEVD